MGILGNTLATQGVDGLDLEMLLVLVILDLFVRCSSSLPQHNGRTDGRDLQFLHDCRGRRSASAKSAAKVTTAAVPGGERPLPRHAIEAVEAGFIWAWAKPQQCC